MKKSTRIVTLAIVFLMFGPRSIGQQKITTYQLPAEKSFDSTRPAPRAKIDTFAVPSRQGEGFTPATAAPAKSEEESYILNVNDRAADFSVQMVDGTTINLSDLKGKVVLLNFWATWCGPCMAEFAEIPSKILKEFEGKDVVFLPVARGETKEVVLGGLQKLKTRGIEFNSGYDPDKKIWDQYASVYIPKNFIIDQNGVIRFVSTGNAPGKVDALAAEIRKLLKEKK